MGSVDFYLLHSWGDGGYFEYSLVFLGALSFKSPSVSHVPADVRNLKRGQTSFFRAPVIPGDFEDMPGVGKLWESRKAWLS